MENGGWPGQETWAGGQTGQEPPQQAAEGGVGAGVDGRCSLGAGPRSIVEFLRQEVGQRDLENIRIAVLSSRRYLVFQWCSRVKPASGKILYQECCQVRTIIPWFARTELVHDNYPSGLISSYLYRTSYYIDGGENILFPPFVSLCINLSL